MNIRKTLARSNFAAMMARIKKARMLKEIVTKYTHDYEADGRRLARPCGGKLAIIVPAPGEDDYVHVRCSKCGEGYRFEIELRRGNIS